jgi:hypothetical protein
VADHHREPPRIQAPVPQQLATPLAASGVEAERYAEAGEQLPQLVRIAVREPDNLEQLEASLVIVGPLGRNSLIKR